MAPDFMRRYLPPWALAVSLNGFWIYLGTLDLVGVAPHAPITAAWYVLVGTACLGGAWIGRRTLIRRLTASSPRPTRWFVIAGFLVAAWFCLNVLFVSHNTSLSRTFAALLVFWTLPSTILAISLSRESAGRLIHAFAATGIGYAAIEWTALIHSHGKQVRFSPLAHLDPITAAQFPALGALALLASVGQQRLGAIRWALVIVLIGGVIAPGSRGPILAVAMAAVAVVVLSRRQRLLGLCAVAAGFAIGLTASRETGSSKYLTNTFPSDAPPVSHGDPQSVAQPISTLHIRQEWWTSVIKGIPDRPVVGHGVASFVDNTPEARRMGVAGKATYPHNSPLESLYSLGILGAVPYAVYLLAAATAVLALARRFRDRSSTLISVGLWIFAFTSANLSGEIGADAMLWAAGGLAVGLYADSAAARR